jgi:glutamyl-tRNA synthetase/glutamyl-Q tRNA(Asp) synthetase
VTGRFAPSTTGFAHPGTLLAALLCWLDARSRGGRVILRLEDLDPARCRPEWAEGMLEALAWLGLDWDAVQRQSEARADHEAALDRLAAAGRLYPCACTRSWIRARGERTPDGGFRYPGSCRERPLPPGGWRESPEPLRARLPEGTVALSDESGLDLSQDPAVVFGDPVVRRRDGATAYHLASVVDDAVAGVTRVVRGRDLAHHSATQARLRELLGWPVPAHRHHLLLLERHGAKLAKLHGAVGLPALRAAYDAPALCGFLAWVSGLRPGPGSCRPAELRDGFAWQRVARADREVSWDGRRLHWSEVGDATPPGPARSAGA